jgi:hypothetical protein
LGAPNCHYNCQYSKDGSKGPNIPIYKNDKMIGRLLINVKVIVCITIVFFYRYYEDITMDKGLSNYTQMLTLEAMKYISKRSISRKPFFLYWAPDSTHDPTYASEKFRHTSKRGDAAVTNGVKFFYIIKSF